MATGQEILHLKLMSYKNKARPMSGLIATNGLLLFRKRRRWGRKDVLFRLSKSRWV